MSPSQRFHEKRTEYEIKDVEKSMEHDQKTDVVAQIAKYDAIIDRAKN